MLDSRIAYLDHVISEWDGIDMELRPEPVDELQASQWAALVFIDREIKHLREVLGALQRMRGSVSLGRPHI